MRNSIVFRKVMNEHNEKIRKLKNKEWMNNIDFIGNIIIKELEQRNGDKIWI